MDNENSNPPPPQPPVANLLSPDEWALAHQHLNSVKPLLAALPPVETNVREMSTQNVVNKTVEGLNKLGTWVKSSVSETDLAMKQHNTPGGFWEAWTELKSGYLRELNERYAATERVWKDLFGTSPLDETPHGRAKFAKQATDNVTTIANSVKDSAKAAADMAKLATDAEKSERKMFWVAVVAACAAVLSVVATGIQAYYAQQSVELSRLQVERAVRQLEERQSPQPILTSGRFEPDLYISANEIHDGGRDANRGLTDAAPTNSDSGRLTKLGAKRGQNSQR